LLLKNTRVYGIGNMACEGKSARIKVQIPHSIGAARGHQGGRGMEDRGIGILVWIVGFMQLVSSERLDECRKRAIHVVSIL
jgi:hypothetical protein